MKKSEVLQIMKIKLFSRCCLAWKYEEKKISRARQLERKPNEFNKVIRSEGKCNRALGGGDRA